MQVNIPDSFTNLSTRLLKSASVSADFHDASYREGSLLPLNNPVPSEDTFGTANYGLQDTILCFKMEDPQLEGLIENLGIRDVQSREELTALIHQRQHGYHSFRKKFQRYFSKFTTQPFVLHDIYAGEKAQFTSTRDHNNAEQPKIGLHFDTWDALTVDELTSSQNRICINLGRGHRYFLFSPLTVFEMREALENAGVDPTLLSNSYEVQQQFFSHFDTNEFPIYFIRLEPFEGYIAPTETVLHDGSNFDSDYCDIQITARGYFSL